MLMNILPALLKNDRDKIYLQVIDYLVQESRTIKQRYRQDCGKRMVLNDEQRLKLAELARPIIKHGFRDVITVFSPDTLMKWYRRLSAKKFDSSTVPRKPGRPSTPGWVCRQVLKMARENRTWGSERIAGQISNLYFAISDETVRQILRRHGLEPAPQRECRGTWREFLKRHWDVLSRHRLLHGGGPDTAGAGDLLHMLLYSTQDTPGRSWRHNGASGYGVHETGHAERHGVRVGRRRIYHSRPGRQIPADGRHAA